jgi:DNA-directed RNA polymerase subunit M/transcription elongation factor TFIIS
MENHTSLPTVHETSLSDPFKRSGLFCRTCKNMMYPRVECMQMVSICRACGQYGGSLPHLQANNLLYAKSEETVIRPETHPARFLNDPTYGRVQMFHCPKCAHEEGVVVTEEDASACVLCARDGCGYVCKYDADGSTTRDTCADSVMAQSK